MRMRVGASSASKGSSMRRTFGSTASAPGAIVGHAETERDVVEGGHPGEERVLLSVADPRGAGPAQFGPAACAPFYSPPGMTRKPSRAAERPSWASRVTKVRPVGRPPAHSRAAPSCIASAAPSEWSRNRRRA